MKHATDTISDEVFKDRVRKFNRATGIFYALLLFVVAIGAILDELNYSKLYLLLYLIPLSWVIYAYKKYPPSMLKDYQEFARNYLFARKLYDNKFAFIIISALAVSSAILWLAVKYLMSILV